MARIDEARVPIPRAPNKFIHKLRAFIRARGLSASTEKVYVNWVKRLIKFHGMRHPETMSPLHVERFLYHLAVVDEVTQNTQKTALNACAFLFNQFLRMPLGHIHVTRARRSRKAPIVFSHREAMQLIASLDTPFKLVAALMYGSGLRVNEALTLRLQDIDFGNKTITIRNAKGNRDRVTLLPESIVGSIRNQIALVADQHKTDLLNGDGRAFMPIARSQKNADKYKQACWQYLFPSRTLSYDPSADTAVRHHMNSKTIQRQIKYALRRCNILKDATPHTFRHSFATRLMERGTNIRKIQELLGHAHVKTTMDYIHVLKHPSINLRSPLDSHRNSGG